MAVSRGVTFGIGLAVGIAAASWFFISIQPKLAEMFPRRGETPPVVAPRADITVTTPPQPEPAPATPASPSPSAPAPSDSSAPADPAPPARGPKGDPPAAPATAPATDMPPVTPATPEPREVTKSSVAAAPPATPATDTAGMRLGGLIIPVEGIRPSQISDTFNDRRGGGRPHEALDIMAPRGTPVRAVADGRIVKLFDSKPGGLTLYQFDPAGTLAYYYAHLDRYAAGIAAGVEVKQGQVIGYVGSTGNASPDAPHLHFAIFKLGPEKNWWQGTPINPYPHLVTR